MIKFLQKFTKPTTFGRTVVFNLPAVRSCPRAGECTRWCYARKGRYVFPAVRASHQRNLDYATNKLSVLYQCLTGELLRLTKAKEPVKAVRVHGSGDFFSVDYAEMWLSLARLFPQVTFYAYTKSHVMFTTEKVLRDLPSNFILIQSVGGLDDERISDSLPVARVFSSEHEAECAGYVLGSHDDGVAARGTIKIGLVKH